MARGAKKSLQEKITQKEELIESLSIRIKKEREELNELLEQQKNEELNELRMVMQKTGMEIADIIQIAQTRMAEA
ncbi:MAG: hypothetical protein IJN64_15035 [Lachnospiraceae bacterium]|nr:hypothetical protein [Lachnospiraceae bacterium]